MVCVLIFIEQLKRGKFYAAAMAQTILYTNIMYGSIFFLNRKKTVCLTLTIDIVTPAGPESYR